MTNRTPITVGPTASPPPGAVVALLTSPELWLLLVAAATRLVPHPPNFTAVGAMALFAGATLRRPLWLAFGAMLLSDLVLGFHATLPFVYLAFAIAVGLGWLLRRRSGIAVWTGAAIGSSLLFFFITNFGVWAVGGLYPRTAEGLATCFAAAVPFYRNTLVGDLVFTGALFGVLRLARGALARSGIHAEPL